MERRIERSPYSSVSKHLFRRTARARERTLTAFLLAGDWDALEAYGIVDPEGINEFRVSPQRRNGWWRVQVR